MAGRQRRSLAVPESCPREPAISGMMFASSLLPKSEGLSMARPLLVAALLLPALLSGSGARADSAGGMEILAATVRFSRTGEGTLRLAGDLVAVPGLASFSPLETALQMSLGPSGLWGGGPLPPGYRFRDLGNRGWSLLAPKAYNGRGGFALRMFPATGRFVLEARGFDGSALVDAGPAGVLFELGIGQDGFSDTVTFKAKSPRRWTFRNVPSAGQPPGGGNGTTPPPGPAPGPISNATTVAQGTQSAITGFRFEVIGDAAAWQSLWQQHGGVGIAPAVDFGTEMVVGVWLGSRSTGGYTANIENIVVAQILGMPNVGPGIIAMIREDQPGPNCVVTTAVTYPFHIVRTARNIGGGAMWESSTRTVNCP